MTATRITPAAARRVIDRLSDRDRAVVAALSEFRLVP